MEEKDGWIAAASHQGRSQTSAVAKRSEGQLKRPVA